MSEHQKHDYDDAEAAGRGEPPERSDEFDLDVRLGAGSPAVYTDQTKDANCQPFPTQETCCTNCDQTCAQTCPGTCEATCYNTCPPTCYATCPASCVQTCSTCNGDTCQATCAQTCGWSCQPTCASFGTCGSTCGTDPTCARP